MERRVLVTGAGSGIGLATALHLDELGFGVVGLVPGEREALRLSLEARRRRERATARRPAATRRPHLRVVVADLADPSARAAFDVEGLALYGLVNNAGVMNAGLLRDVPLADARAQLESMVLAPVDLARRALTPMVEREEGCIVSIASAAVHAATPFTGWYQACKAALRELTGSLRLEVRSAGVAVVEIEPGGVASGIWPRARAELARRQARSRRPEAYERALKATHYRRLMTDPQRVAEAVGRALTTVGPRPRQRVGPDAAALRVASEILPARWWDRLSGRISGAA